MWDGIREFWALGAPERVTLVAVLLGFIPANLYPFLYSQVRWYKSSVGRSLMAKGIALALVFDAAAASLFLADHRWFRWIVAVVDMVLVLAVTYQIRVLRQTIREGELERRIGEQPPKVTNKSSGRPKE